MGVPHPTPRSRDRVARIGVCIGLWKEGYEKFSDSTLGNDGIEKWRDFLAWNYRAVVEFMWVSFCRPKWRHVIAAQIPQSDRRAWFVAAGTGFQTRFLVAFSCCKCHELLGGSGETDRSRNSRNGQDPGEGWAYFILLFSCIFFEFACDVWERIGAAGPSVFFSFLFFLSINLSLLPWKGLLNFLQNPHEIRACWFRLDDQSFITIIREMNCWKSVVQASQNREGQTSSAWCVFACSWEVREFLFRYAFYN